MHPIQKYKFVSFLTQGTMFPVQNTGKHIVFQIATVNRSRNDSANNSIYCNSISSTGQKEQILSYKTINQRKRKSKQKTSTQDLQEIANKSDYEVLNNFCVSLNCVPSTSVSPHPCKLKISKAISLHVTKMISPLFCMPKRHSPPSYEYTKQEDDNNKTFAWFHSPTTTNAITSSVLSPDPFRDAVPIRIQRMG